MARIVFFCHDTMHNIETTEYYYQDIKAMRALGHDVVICNRYRDIPKKYDAIFIWWWTYALVPVLMARLRGRIAIITGTFNFRYDERASGTDYFGRPWHQRVLIGLATRLATANVFVGRKEFEAVPAHFGLGNVFYAPHAVGDDYFAVRDRAEQRTLLLNLAWSGPENLQRKGVWTILEAAALLKGRGRCFELILAGKRGDAFPVLQQRIVDLGLADCVRAIGEVTQEEKLNLFAQTKLYLQPSYFEGFGLATAEAAAAGCCIITTDVGEVRTVIGEGGVYIRPGDAEELADAIERLLANETVVERLNMQALEHIRLLFSAHAKGRTFGQIFSSLGITNQNQQG